MPENTTSRLALPYPSGTGAVKLGAQNIGELANELDEIAVTLNITARGGTFTANYGELCKTTVTAAGTLPAVAKNAIVGFVCTANETTITTASGLIYGDFVTGAASIKLAANQHVILQSDGTNWFIIAGEPKREQAYTNAESLVAGTEYEPSATRPVFVVVRAHASIEAEAVVTVGGQFVGIYQNHSATQTVAVSFPFICLPGEKWKIIGATGISRAYLIL
jgi:hypothetical protein